MLICTKTRAVQKSINAGVKCIEHGHLMVTDCLTVIEQRHLVMYATTG